jgi:hypothetical protein
MRITHKNFCLLAGFLLWLPTAEAQKNRSLFESYATVGGGVGVATYVGDLASYRQMITVYPLFKMMRYNANINYTRYFTPYLGARAEFMWARIAGDDEFFNRGGSPTSGNYIRNLHFANNLKEFSLVGIINLRGEGRNAMRRVSFMPYLFGGVAAVAHNPKAKVPTTYDKVRWVALQPLGTEGQGQPGYEKPYSLVTFSIPFGAGFRWKYNDRWDFGIEGGFRFSGSDYLDDVSTTYANPDVLRSLTARDLSNRSLEPIAARTGKDRTSTVAKILDEPASTVLNQTLVGYDIGDARGNPNRKDAYLIGSFKVSYTLPSQIKCPPIR